MLTQNEIPAFAGMTFCGRVSLILTECGEVTLHALHGAGLNSNAGTKKGSRRDNAVQLSRKSFFR
jgi:hypothetical protein